MTSSHLQDRSDVRFDSYAQMYNESTYSRFSQEHFSGGTFGATLLLADQEPIDVVDPCLPEIVIQCAAFRTGAHSVGTDVGDGFTKRDGGPGRIFVAPADTDIRYKIDTPHSALCLAIPKANFLNLCENHHLEADCLGRYSEGLTENKAAWTHLQRLWKFKDSESASSLLFDAVLLELLASLTNQKDSQPRPSDARIARTVDYIEVHFGEALNIGQLASVACLSPAHFSRLFKMTVGEPVWAYVQRRRCVRAKEMLLGTQLPLIEIAFRCGFSGQAHFTRSIARYLGVTPGQIRAASG